MEKITFGDSLPGYEIGAKDLPALIVLQEWWGVNEIIKEQAITFASHGYRALVPDLYKGALTSEAEEAGHMMGNLDFVLATSEIKQAVEYLKSTGSPKVGVVGFCMGGALAFCAAQHAGVDCAAPFYGTPAWGAAKACEVEKITVPVQGHFGRHDAVQGFSDPATAEAVHKKMKDAGCPIELFIYENSGHSFFNLVTDNVEAAQKEFVEHTHPYDKADIQLAYTRVMDFFSKHLK